MGRKRTPKTVTARKIKYEITERNISYQSMKIAPIKDAFEEPRMIKEYVSGYMAGKPKYRDKDEDTVKLKIADDGRIGPIERMVWWRIWEGDILE